MCMCWELRYCIAIWQRGGDCHVEAERKKQAAVLKTEGESGYIKMKDKVLPTSLIEEDILWEESVIMRHKQEKERIFVYAHVHTSDTMQNKTREVNS